MTKQNRAKVGHNQGVNAEKLKQYVERIERLNEQKSDLTADIRDIFAEAKANGYDAKTMRKVIARRKLDVNEREEQDYMLGLYEGVFA